MKAQGNRSLFTQVPVPVSFCCLEFDSDDVEYATRAIGILHNGYIITSPRRLRLGSLISLRLRMPLDEFNGAYWENRCTGWVTAEQRVDGGVFSYRIEIDSRPRSGFGSEEKGGGR